MADTENSLVETQGIPEIDMEVEVFGMTQAEVDKTLTIEDCAADAKAVGDQFGNVDADISDLDAAIRAVEDRVTDVEGWSGEDIPVNEGSSTSIADAISELQRSTVQNVYPVGSIYMSTSETAPSFFGTTWEEILITATWSQLKNGMRSHAAGVSTGTVHFWVRTA